MDDTIKELIRNAQVVIDGLNREPGANISEAQSIRHDVLRWAGFKGDAICDKTWGMYITMMPAEIRGTMLLFDDALNLQDTRSMMYNL